VRHKTGSGQAKKQAQAWAGEKTTVLPCLIGVIFGAMFILYKNCHF
jgi:hypothetical protein